MIKSRTWNGTAGLNYIQDSELAFATIYSVKREGTGHDYFVSGDNNRKFIHETSTGKILFPFVFNAPGERVFVIYKPAVGTEPTNPVCVPVTFSDSLPNGVLNQPYNKTITLSGTQPFTIGNITKPSWMTITNSTNTVTFTGTPDTLGTTPVAVDITNCGDTLTLSQNIFIMPELVNLFIQNTVPGTVIWNVFGFPYFLINPFPVGPGQTITGSHNGFTAVTQVILSLPFLPFTQFLRLERDGFLVQNIPVTVSGPYNFSSHSFLATEVTKITLL